MADNIVGGLFGVDPSQIQQQRMSQDLKEGYMLAQLSPMERATAGMYAGAKQLSRAGQGLLGMEDPELAEAAMAKKLSENFNVNSVEGLNQLSAALLQAGSPRYSQLAAQQAMELKKQGFGLEKTKSEIAKNLREKQMPTSPLGKLMFERDELLKAGIPPNDPRVIAYNRNIAAEGEGKAPRITIDQRGQTAFATGLGAEDAKRVNTAEKLIVDAAGTLGTLKQMAEKDALGVVSGTGAPARIEVLKFLDTAGFTTPAEKSKLANSENFNKLTGDLVLERIKMLGTNPSNADRDFIKAIVPQLESSAAARKQLINYMADKANTVVKEASALSEYGRKNQGLSGYKPTIPLVDVTTPTRDITSYSIQELEEMNKKAKPAGAK